MKLINIAIGMIVLVLTISILSSLLVVSTDVFESFVYNTTKLNFDFNGNDLAGRSNNQNFLANIGLGVNKITSNKSLLGIIKDKSSFYEISSIKAVDDTGTTNVVLIDGFR